VGLSVSIIIPVFNSEKTLGETLESVFLETTNRPDVDWEILVLDDGSTDKTLEVLKLWETKIPLTTFELPHSGSPAKPRNHGIEASTGDYVFFLDADDVLLLGGLAAAVDFATKNNSDVVVPRLKSLDGRGVPRGMFSKNRSQATLEDSRIYWALNPMKLIKRSLLMDSDIRFDESLKRDEDQPFVFRSYLAAKKISVLADPPVVGVRYSPSGTNLTLRKYEPSDLFQYLETMTSIMDSANLGSETKFFLLIRNWEIEISREFIWKRLGLLDEATWITSFEKLNEFSRACLLPDMLPRTSIRWRGIVGLVGKASYRDLNMLLRGRRLVLENKSVTSKFRGIVISNWIRLKASIRLPKSF
jgi:glycosyltransferase involved in cell wall biosynthesis